MRILFICNEYPPDIHGGIGIFVKGLAENLVTKGIDCSVIGIYPYLKKSVKETVNDVTIYRKKLGPFITKKNNILNQILYRLQLGYEICRLENDNFYNIIESFDWSGPLLFKPKAKLIVRLHGSNTAHAKYDRSKVSKFLFFFESLNLKYADYLISVSNHISQITKQAFPKLNLESTVIYNFVDLEKFRLNLQIKRDPKKILFVGKYHVRKGVFELFRILNILLSFDKELTFTFIGRHDDEQKRQLVNILDLEFRSRILFVNTLPHTRLPDYYASSNLMIMPSKAEAFGLTAIEAMACGCIVAMANKASGPELISDTIDGILLEIDDYKSSAEKLYKILTDYKHQEEIRRNAKQKVVKFDKNLIIQQNLEFYKSIL